MRRARIISVGGGKGGVGKSVLAANLSVALAQAGVEVILVDGDLGAANQHTLFGIEHKVPTLQALVDRDVDSLQDTMIETGIPRLRLVAGSSATPGAANLAHTQKQKLLRHIRTLPAEVVVVDVGAGVAFNTIDLFAVADVRVSVLSPQLPSLQNAYAFLKGVVVRSLEQLAEGDERTLLDDGVARQTDRVPAMIARLADTAPALAARANQLLYGFGAQLVGNQATMPTDVNIFHAVERMLRDFLGIDAPVVGVVPTSLRLHTSVNRRSPLCLDSPHDEAARAIRQIAHRLLDAAIPVRGDVEPLPVAASAVDPELPALDTFARSHPRHRVDWVAELNGRRGRLREVSLSGALMELDQLPAVGTEGQLIVAQYGANLRTIVRSKRNGSVGLQFLGPYAPVATRLVTAATQPLQARTAR